jgi:hypothetical protein
LEKAAIDFDVWPATYSRSSQVFSPPSDFPRFFLSLFVFVATGVSFRHGQVKLNALKGVASR